MDVLGQRLATGALAGLSRVGREFFMEINGRPHQLPGPMTLAELLVLVGYESRQVAVMLNDQIIPQTALAATQVGDGDRLEVVSFVGGGQP